MEKLLTVIVPSYNMEALLAKDLQTLVIGNRPERLEVLVINDGSKDNTLEIARDFESRYPGIFKVIDKPNGNYGSCVNAGLAVATGKYIKILDADDSVDTAAFEGLVDVLETVDADVVVNDYQKVYTGGKREDYEYSFPKGKTVRIADIYTEESFSTLLLPALTYRTSILKNMAYRQTEGISYTDTEWCYAPMTQMTTLYYFNRPVYIYLMGREGQTMDPEVFRKTMPQRFKCFYSLLDSLDNLHLEPWAIRYADNQITKHATGMYNFYLIDFPNENREHLKELDLILKEKNHRAYTACGSIVYRKKIPYKYIAEWRSGQNNIPYSVRAKEKIYDILGTVHYYILKTFNPDLKR
jgi:hypothetical protein